MNRQVQLRRRPRVGVGAMFAAVVVIGLTAEARAHFLFIRIGTQAEAGRSAEVFFSEQAEAGDPRFIPKVAHTKLWVQTTPGDFRELAVQPGTDRLRAALPADRSLVVVGECQYGVLARPNQTPFLLRYYPKAVTGVADELNRMVPRREIAFEIRATFEGNGAEKSSGNASHGVVRLSVLRDGRPVPNAVFTAIDSDLTEGVVKAGPDGSAVWTPPAPGRYSIYVRETIPQKGTLDGKAYDEIREFATLALAWPLEHREADAEADALFSRCHRAPRRMAQPSRLHGRDQRLARRPAVRRLGHRQGRWLGQHQDRRQGRQALAPGPARFHGHAPPASARARLPKRPGRGSGSSRSPRSIPSAS